VSVRINLKDIAFTTSFILNNVKTISQIKKDLTNQDCYVNLNKRPVNSEKIITMEEFFEDVSGDIESICYYDGRIFYKVGNEFHTPEIAMVFNEIYGKS